MEKVTIKIPLQICSFGVCYILHQQPSFWGHPTSFTRSCTPREGKKAAPKEQHVRNPPTVQLHCACVIHHSRGHGAKDHVQAFISLLRPVFGCLLVIAFFQASSLLGFRVTIQWSLLVWHALDSTSILFCVIIWIDRENSVCVDEIFFFFFLWGESSIFKNTLVHVD